MSTLNERTKRSLQAVSQGCTSSEHGEAERQSLGGPAAEPSVALPVRCRCAALLLSLWPCGCSLGGPAVAANHATLPLGGVRRCPAVAVLAAALVGMVRPPTGHMTVGADTPLAGDLPLPVNQKALTKFFRKIAGSPVP